MGKEKQTDKTGKKRVLDSLSSIPALGTRWQLLTWGARGKSVGVSNDPLMFQKWICRKTWICQMLLPWVLGALHSGILGCLVQSLTPAPAPQILLLIQVQQCQSAQREVTWKSIRSTHRSLLVLIILKKKRKKISSWLMLHPTISDLFSSFLSRQRGLGLWFDGSPQQKLILGRYF